MKEVASINPKMIFLHLVFQQEEEPSRTWNIPASE